MEKKRWTQDEAAYVLKNFGKVSFEDMGKELGRTAMSVRLFVLRRRISVAESVKRNLLMILLKTKFKHPEDFCPSRKFYEEVGIGQRRFWSLYHGRKAITPKEYHAVASYLGITPLEAFEARQLNLFEEEGK